MPRLQLRIEVNVDAPPDTMATPYVIDALQELTNRRDFRAGALKAGRVLEYDVDHNDVRVTVDMTRLIIETHR